MKLLFKAVIMVFLVISLIFVTDFMLRSTGDFTGYAVWWTDSPGIVINETSDFDAGTKVNVATESDRYAMAADTLEFDFPYTEKDDDLLGYWRFEEGIGSTFENEIETGYDGSLVNSPSWTVGVFGNAVSFYHTANNSYGSISAPDITDTLNRSFTITAWIKHDLIEQYGVIVGNPDWDIALYTGTNSGDEDKLEFYIWDEGTNDVEITGTTVFQTGKWYMVSVVRNDTSIKLYVNGQEDASGTFNYDINMSGQAILIGDDSYQDHFHGAIDEVKIYDRSLSADEISHLYNHGDKYIGTSGTWTSAAITIPAGKMMENMTIKYTASREYKIDDVSHKYYDFSTTKSGLIEPGNVNWVSEAAETELEASDNNRKSESLIPALASTASASQLFEFDIGDVASGNITWEGSATISGEPISASALKRFYIWNETSSAYDMLWSFGSFEMNYSSTLTQDQIRDGLRNGKIYFMAAIHGQTAGKAVNLHSDYIRFDIEKGFIDKVEFLNSNNDVIAYNDTEISSDEYVFYDSNYLDSGDLAYLNNTDMKIRVYLSGNGNSTPVIDDIIGFYEDIPAGPNHAPTITLTTPIDGLSDLVSPVILKAVIHDQDLDTMNVSFYQSTGTLIETQTGKADGTTVSVAWSDLDAGTTYSWYAKVTDGINTTQSATRSFTTKRAAVYVPSAGGGLLPPPPEPEKEITIEKEEIYTVVERSTGPVAEKSEAFEIENTGEGSLNVSIVVKEINGTLELEETNFTLEPGQNKTIKVKSFVPEDPEAVGEYRGQLIISSNGIQKIVDITVLATKAEAPLPRIADILNIVREEPAYGAVLWVFTPWMFFFGFL